MDTAPQRPDAAPFAYSGARVDIEERPAQVISGTYGVVAIAVLVVIAIVLIVQAQARYVVLPILAIFVIAQRAFVRGASTSGLK